MSVCAQPSTVFKRVVLLVTGLRSYLPQSNNFILFRQFWKLADAQPDQVSRSQPAVESGARHMSPSLLPALPMTSPHARGKVSVRPMTYPHPQGQGGSGKESPFTHHLRWDAIYAAPLLQGCMCRSWPRSKHAQAAA
ncbi:hypothetical protein WJX84_001279 [Apatococcus fuscideae]|uniref:Uncharacterized protein n=1 Tax=Apatococcus fuscideae TaxID=2026836 RepID=A0AAW1T2B7_9CHLO